MSDTKKKVTDQKTAQDSIEAVSPLTDSAGKEVAKANEETRYSQSGGLSNLMAKLDLSVAFSSYQSGLLYTLGHKSDGGTHVHQSAMAKPMGIFVDEKGGFMLSSGYQIMRFQNALEPHERVNEIFDGCFVARECYNTGQLDAHDIGIDKNDAPVFVNTRFNCLATTDSRHSFKEIWRPAFISELIDEDRCHLNGLAMQGGEPAYVTAVSQSNTIDGWRDRRSGGGVIIDVRTNKVICEGLSMPHSPRIYKDKLWVLNSGTGELGIVEGADTGKGKFVPQVFCPGFVRGLAFHGNYAFIGLSKPRYERFEGLPLDQKLKDADSEPWCGIQIIDLEKKRCVEWFRIDGPVAEIYDVALLKGVACPMVISDNGPEIRTLVTYAGSAAPLPEEINVK